MISDKVKLNSVCSEAGPSLACGTPTTNPFPENRQVYVGGAFTNFKQVCVVALHAGSTAIISLSIGELHQIIRNSMTSVDWYCL